MLRPIRYADLPQGLHGGLPALQLSDPFQKQGKGHVLPGRQLLQKLKALKNKADFVPAQGGKRPDAARNGRRWEGPDSLSGSAACFCRCRWGR